MKILVCKTFGLGNVVMCIPTLKALKSLPHVDELDVLIGSTRDDRGAYDVLRCLLGTVIDKIYFDSVPDKEHDLAIMSIPYDGRWLNGVHFNAKRVMDGRTRPDPSTTGLISWKKSEVEYQMDNARELGYYGETPSTEFYHTRYEKYETKNRVYLGVGYKKDDAGIWKIKHWGNDNFSNFAALLLSKWGGEIVSTGDILDWKCSLHEIDDNVGNSRFNANITSLELAFHELSQCKLYIGNDSGMMHVAASMGIQCLSYFGMKLSKNKASPQGDNHFVLESVSPELMVDLALGVLNE